LRGNIPHETAETAWNTMSTIQSLSMVLN